MSELELSIVVVFYNMHREGPRTLLSLVPGFQNGLKDVPYEIIGIDHGSQHRVAPPQDPELLSRLRMEVMSSAPVSPVKAINDAVRNLCRGKYVLICIDGARIASSHLIAQSLKAANAVTNPFVVSLSWHLGPDVQARSAANGYCQAVEDELLKKIDWHQNPDALFAASVFSGSSRFGYFRPVAESNSFCMTRKRYLEIGGYNESFQSPGAGLANLEIFKRCVEDETHTIVTLVGDGTFHQFHGGASTSDPTFFSRHKEEYRRLTGHEYRVPVYTSLFVTRRPQVMNSAMDVSLANATML